jgi:cyanate permease
MIRSTFALPAILAIASLLGLIVALAGDGWRDAVTWLTLALPAVAVGWAAQRKESSQRSSAPDRVVRKRDHVS